MFLHNVGGLFPRVSVVMLTRALAMRMRALPCQAMRMRPLRGDLRESVIVSHQPLMPACDLFTHILQCSSASEVSSKAVDKISRYLTTTIHGKYLTYKVRSFPCVVVVIIRGMYCIIGNQSCVVVVIIRGMYCIVGNQPCVVVVIIRGMYCIIGNQSCVVVVIIRGMYCIVGNQPCVVVVIIRGMYCIVGNEYFAHDLVMYFHQLTIILFY